MVIGFTFGCFVHDFVAKLFRLEAVIGSIGMLLAVFSDGEAEVATAREVAEFDIVNINVLIIVSAERNSI